MLDLIFMTRNKHVNSPPPYQIHHPAAYTAGRDDQSNLLFRQHSNYGSVLPPQEAKKSHTLTKSLLLGFFLLIAASLVMFAISCYPAHDKIRREWDAEEHDHQILREAWNSERKAIAVEREGWKKERADHENWKYRKDEGKRSLIVWDNLTPSNKCLRYGTREYSATLANECWKKSIDIHGRQILPTRCDTQGICGVVTGHWVVDFNEATCVTWWNGYYDKGCVERGIHRYESGLVNLQSGDDWEEMCATTPAHVQGKDFDGPTSCATWWPTGIHGIWMIEDANCP